MGILHTTQKLGAKARYRGITLLTGKREYQQSIESKYKPEIVNFLSEYWTDGYLNEQHDGLRPIFTQEEFNKLHIEKDKEKYISLGEKILYEKD